MSYNIASSGTLNTATSNLKVASDAYVSYTPDYQKLVISGNGANFGICYTGFTVDSGGHLDMSNRAYVSGLTVLSGGTATGASWGAWKDLTVSAGGSVTFLAGKLQGNINIAQGAIVGDADAYASGGVFYNWDNSLSLDIYEGVVFSNCSLDGTIWVMDGAAVRDVTVGGATLYAYNSCTIYNITATAGNFNVYNYWVNFNLGGANTNIAAGKWTNDANVYVTNGVVHNLNLHKENKTVQRVTLTEGIVGDAVIVGDSGVLTVGSAGSASGATVTNNGVMYVAANGEARSATVSTGGKMYVSSAGKASDTVISDGGKMYVSYGGIADGVTVMNGGTAAYIVSSWYRPDIVGLVVSEGGTATAENYVQWKSMDVKSGGYFSCANVKIYGNDINIASGAWVNCPDAFVSGGIINNYSGTLGLDFYDGAGVRNAQLGGYTYLFSGTTATDVAVTNGGKMFISAYAIVSGVTVSSGGVMNASGNNAYTAPYYENVTIEEGGYLEMFAKARISALTVSSGGTALGASWGSWKDVTVESGGSAILNAAKLYGSNFNMAEGTIYVISGGTPQQCASAYAVDGVFYNLDIAVGIDAYDVTGFRNCKASAMLGLCTENITVCNLTATAAGSYLYLQSYWQNVILGGSETEIGVGHFYNNADWYVTSGVLHGMNLRKEGSGLQRVTLIEGLAADAPIVGNSGVLTVGSGGSASDLVVVTGGTAKITAGGAVDGADVLDGAFNLFDGPEATGTVRDAIVAENVRVSGGQAFVRGSNALGSNYNVLNGLMYVQNGATADGIEIAGGTVSAYVNNNELCVDYDADAATVENVTLTTGNLNIGDRGIADGVAVAGGSMSVNTSGAAMNVEQTGGRIIVNGSGAFIDGATVYGGNMSIGNGGALNDATISGGTVVVRHVAGWAATTEIKSAVASDVRIETGAGLTLESGGILQAGKLADGATLTVYKGGQAGFASAAAGATINLNFWDVNSGATGNEHGLVSNWGDFSSGATVNVQSIDFGGTSYKIADEANANVTLNVIGYHDIYEIAVKSGKQYSNAFWGMNFDFSDGMTLATNTFSVGVENTAAALNASTATALADGGFAAIWTANTDTSGVTVVADANTTGDAWVTVNGATLATPLYGAQGNFAHDVNMWIYEGTVRNLAAGATAGGSVENVNLLISDNGEGTDKLTFSGVAYLGGFGSVTGEVTAAVYGGTFAKDLYAGALANKNASASDVGAVNLTVKNGKFSGNIYGGSAVKTDTTVGNGIRNTTGDVTLTVTGGETDKGTQACIFAGGYATGNATGTVYTVENVTLDISGGSWGEACGGRGIFGGIMASGVEAEVLGDVNLTVSGGSMGNVYGGGWAQKANGKSIVGDVSITIAGTAQVANVFGGGSHSSSGGTTETGDITITVAGGDITGAIYAKGQLEGDTTGTARVIFTGANDYGCDVFGYTKVGGSGNSDALIFTDYTGTLSGTVGGFEKIAIGGDTALTFGGGASVSNNAWTFDFTDRNAGLAATAALSGAVLTDSNTVAVSFADEAQAKGSWSIAEVTVATGASASFDLTVGGDIIATNLAYGVQISGGVYDGWGFALDTDDVLKFKQLA